MKIFTVFTKTVTAYLLKYFIILILFCVTNNLNKKNMKFHEINMNNPILADIIS